MADFIVNKAGAKIYKDITKHEVMKIPVVMNDKTKGVVHHVLSVGMAGTLTHREPVATIKRSNQEVVVYRLPVELQGWVEHSMGMVMQGFKPFPTDIEFGTLDGRTYAEML